MALHAPTFLFTYSSNSSSTDSGAWSKKFNQRIELASFCVQKTIISGICVWSTVRMLGSIHHSFTRKVMTQFIFIIFIDIIVDIVLIFLEYANNYVREASIKPIIYAIKLKIKFTILDPLMNMTKAGHTRVNRQRGRLSLELQKRGFCSHSTTHAKFSIWHSIRVAKTCTCAPTESLKIQMKITTTIKSKLFVTSATLVLVQNLTAHHAQLWSKTIQREQRVVGNRDSECFLVFPA